MKSELKVMEPLDAFERRYKGDFAKIEESISKIEKHVLENHRLISNKLMKTRSLLDFLRLKIGKEVCSKE